MMQDQGTRHRLLGYAGVVDGRVVTSGFLRLPQLDNTDAAELMVHVVPDARRRGHGSAMLAHLEATAAAEGVEALVLETGIKQPEAIELYLSSGYEPVPGFGHYRDSGLSRCFARRLTEAPRTTDL